MRVSRYELTTALDHRLTDEKTQGEMSCYVLPSVDEHEHEIIGVLIMAFHKYYSGADASRLAGDFPATSEASSCAYMNGSISALM